MEDVSGVIMLIALVACVVIIFGVMIFYMVTWDQDTTQKMVREYGCNMTNDPSCILEDHGKYPKFNPPEETP